MNTNAFEALPQRGSGEGAGQAEHPCHQYTYHDPCRSEEEEVDVRVEVHEEDDQFACYEACQGGSSFDAREEDGHHEETSKAARQQAEDGVEVVE